VIEQLPDAAIAPPVSEKVSLVFVVVEIAAVPPPQLPTMLAGTKLSPAGSTSVYATFESAVAAVFVTVKVSDVVSPVPIKLSAKAFAIVGPVIVTSRVSEPVVVPVTSLELTTDVVFV